MDEREMSEGERRVRDVYLGGKRGLREELLPSKITCAVSEAPGGISMMKVLRPQLQRPRRARSRLIVMTPGLERIGTTEVSTGLFKRQIRRYKRRLSA